ncbi:MAG: Xaa-Pro peptidase family protein [Actinomycetota bacterium]|nr:Xaa-Pro peptidase family protein [Actinomycetota bacterium]
MSAPRRDRARSLADGRPLVSADLATVTWLTGLVTEIEWGPSPFSAPPLVVVDPGGSTLVIASEDEAGTVGDGVEARTFPGFAVEDVDRDAAAVHLALEALEGARAVAADVASLPGSLATALGRRGVDILDVGPRLRRARAVKDPDEIEAIRAAVRLADAGQAAARAELTAGRSELELWSRTREAIETEAGGRVPLLADFVSGERTAGIGGPPSRREVKQGDLLLVDLVPRRDGYWADSCATVALGDPPAEARGAHEAARRALERAVSLLRPGVRVADVDREARSVVEAAGGAYPHHSGHGVGTATHEEPRVIPGTDRVLEAGMVVALEPGWYAESWGVRVERVALVTDDEPEILSGHEISM